MAETSVLKESLTRVLRFAAEERLIRRVSRVLVAVSGGQDSLALLLVLRALKAEMALEIEACHFDHRMRPESRADLERVRTICSELGVECVTGEGDVRSVARENRASIEDTARKMRYQFLAFVAGKEHCDVIAAGHTADDQSETVLMRILRGSGIRGMRGMLASSQVPGAPGQRLVRPILCLAREETGAICREAGIEPLVDQSNQDMSLLRNRLRHETLPSLRSLNPSIDEALRGLAASAQEVFAGVEREAMALQPRERTPVGAIFDLQPFRALQDEARTLVVEREASFFKLAPEVNRTRVENLAAMLRRGSGEVFFGDTVAEASCGKVRVGPLLEAAEALEARILNVPGTTMAGGWRVDVSMEPLSALPGDLEATIDSSRISGALRIRTLRPGDRMAYHGLERAVRDVLANEKVPRWERAGALSVADGAKVLAVVAGGQVVADRVEGELAWYVRVGQRPTV